MLKQQTVPEFIAHGGEMGALIRSKDWSQTHLGPPEQWPSSLKTSLSIILRSGYPMFLWWGPELTMFHNDAFIPVLGQKHPAALGGHAKEAWAEVWNDIVGIVDDVFEGKLFYAKDMQFLLGRKGFLEETYWTFSYSPIVDSSGQVAGLFCACNEETEKILHQRRLHTLKELSGFASSFTETSAFASQAVEVLGNNLLDLPFSALYLLDQENSQAKLTNAAGLSSNNELLPSLLKRMDTGAAKFWEIEKLLETGQPVLITNLTKKSVVSAASWIGQVDAAMVLPIHRSGSELLNGFLICGLSSLLEFDEEYQSFLRLVSQQIATGIQHIQAIEAERQRTEALAELNQAKTQFFSNVSHEFRTPLTLILGPVEVALRNPDLPKAEKEWLTSLYRNSKRLQKLVNDLLEFNRLVDGKLEPKYEPVNLAILTGWLAGAFQSAIVAEGIEFEVNCPPLSEPIYVDRGAWEKIVTNLLSNAFKYTFTGSIRTILKEVPNGVVLTISDTGIGIDASEQSKIFDRFHRVEGAKGRSHEGTGIGLAYVKELVELHQGSIQVESELEKGTKMVVTIPKGKSHLPAERVNDDMQYVDAHEGTFSYMQDTITALSTNNINLDGEGFEFPQENIGKYLLIAEDNADMRNHISHLLGKHYEVEVAENGQVAWQKILQRQPDLLVTDVMMPEMDGFTLLQRIRSNKPTQLMPVIMLSAHAGEEAVAEGLARGADDYLVKPFSSIELLSRVNSILKITGAHRQAELNLYNIFKQAPFSFSILKGPDFIIDLVNDVALKNIDRPREEIINRPALEAFPELKTQGFLEIWENVYYKGQRFSATDVPVQLMKNGKFETFYTDFVYEPLYDTSGNIDGIMSVGLDVTDKYLAKKQILESHNYFQMMSDHVPAIIWVARKDGYCTYKNKPWYNYTGLTEKKSEGFGWLDAIHPEDRERVEQVYWKAVNEKNSFTVEARIKSRFGTYRWFEEAGAARFNESGDFQGFVGTVIDISQQKRDKSELERKVQELEQFAYVASHDLQEPLNTIKSFVELIESEHSFNTELTECLKYIKESSERLTSLIYDLLHHSRIGRDGKAQTTDLNKVVSEVIADMKAKIDHEGATILVGPLPTLPVYPTEFRLLFQNLISNAIKFKLNDRLPIVDISAMSEGAFWHFIVADNGIGIEEKYLERIFIIFQRLHTSTEFSGTGIGLAHCKKIIDLHNGKIWVESNVGEGSSFHFTLPK